MSYIVFNAEVRLARDGEPARQTFHTDLFVDTCALPRRRYQYGRAYQDPHTATWYLEPVETLAWHELLLVEEDFDKRPGFKSTGAEMKLDRGRRIEAAREKVRDAENELRRLL
jgi:hypothetical protein